MGFLITILSLGFVIFIHELGHLWAAKRAGVGVLEFSIGMGPRLWGRKVGETEYSLRIFPFGGFVKLAGMDDADTDVPDELNYYKKSVPARLLTISAGSLMNIFLGFVIFLVMYIGLGVPEQTSIVSGVVPASPAARAGLIAGDKIVRFETMQVDAEHVSDMVRVIHQSAGKLLHFEFIRDGKLTSVLIQPEILKVESKEALVGIVFKQEVKHYGVFQGILLSIEATGNRIWGVFHSISYLIHGKAGLKEMSGPIGIVQFAAFGLHQGVVYFLNIIAMISISLGVFNLFPFPVLDGGHMVFLILEAIIGRPINKKWEARVNAAGIVILVSVMVIILINDVVHWQDRMHLFKRLFP